MGHHLSPHAPFVCNEALGRSGYIPSTDAVDLRVVDVISRMWLAFDSPIISTVVLCGCCYGDNRMALLWDNRIALLWAGEWEVWSVWMMVMEWG